MDRGEPERMTDDGSLWGWSDSEGWKLERMNLDGAHIVVLGVRSRPNTAQVHQDTGSKITLKGEVNGQAVRLEMGPRRMFAEISICLDLEGEIIIAGSLTKYLTFLHVWAKDSQGAPKVYGELHPGEVPRVPEFIADADGKLSRHRSLHASISWSKSLAKRFDDVPHAGVDINAILVFFGNAGYSREVRSTSEAGQ